MLPPLGRPIPVPWCGRSKKGMKKERRKVVKKRKKESKQKKTDRLIVQVGNKN
jgi:hypothetical protein